MQAGNQRRLTQLDVHTQCPVQPDEDRQLNEHRQAAGQRVVVVLSEQLPLGRRALLHVVLVLVGDLLHLRRQFLHLLRVARLLDSQRAHATANQHGQQDDGDPVVAEHGVERVQDPCEWLGNPGEPAVRDAVVQTVLCQHLRLFRTGEDHELLRVLSARRQFDDRAGQLERDIGPRRDRSVSFGATVRATASSNV